MKPIFSALFSFVAATARTRLFMQVEILALRHQLAVYQRRQKRPRLRPADRILWSWLAKVWPGWRDALVLVKPETVIAWQRRRLREHWTKLSRSGKPGRPRIPKEIQELIRRMSIVNGSWGSPRIVGELRKLGIELSKSTVEKYMVRHRKPPSQTWRTFLENHVKDLVSVDFFVVPTVRFAVLYVFVVLAHDRRRVLHFNVTANPTARWTAQQITDAFPWDEAPRYLLRDRDGVYGAELRGRVRAAGDRPTQFRARPSRSSNGRYICPDAESSPPPSPRALAAGAGGRSLWYATPMSVQATQVDRGAPGGEDQRITLHDVTWAQFEAFLAIRGDAPVPRTTYLRGELELMSPSFEHEAIKKTIARLLEGYTYERGIPICGAGSWTVKRSLRAAGVEPDECYLFEEAPVSPPRPDLAIEVVWTSGGIAKLEVYRALEVPEVWFWRSGRIEAWQLGANGYVQAARSAFLPDLPLERLAEWLDAPTQHEAVHRMRAWLAADSQP